MRTSFGRMGGGKRSGGGIESQFCQTNAWMQPHGVFGKETAEAEKVSSRFREQQYCWTGRPADGRCSRSGCLSRCRPRRANSTPSRRFTNGYQLHQQRMSCSSQRWLIQSDSRAVAMKLRATFERGTRPSNQVRMSSSKQTPCMKLYRPFLRAKPSES